MLRLQRIEMTGFGPFADTQTMHFADKPGVTVVYGENMRGKTSLLNAIRYAFFGTVLGRGSRARKLHAITNRELSTQGQYGFSVSLSFNYDGEDYELVRSCRPNVETPTNDEHYDQDVLLRRGTSALGPQERDRALLQIFPKEVSRFFLFDGELLQEYEELLINESEAGPKISEAIEKILGVPILKRGRTHLTKLSEEADRAAAREAQKDATTKNLGVSLQQATERKAAHQQEIARLNEQLKGLVSDRAEIEGYLKGVQKYAGLLQDRDEATAKLDDAAGNERSTRVDLQKAMTTAWRSLLKEPVRSARALAQQQVEQDMNAIVMTLRQKAVDAGHCGTCDQDVSEATKSKLRTSLQGKEKLESGTLSAAMKRLVNLGKFDEADNIGEVRQLSKRLRELELEQAALRSTIKELDAALAESEPEVLRRSQASLGDVIERITVVKRAIEEEERKAGEIDVNIQRLKKQLDASGAIDLKASALRANILRSAAEVFDAAVERYKAELRERVESTATQLFLSMTTEKHDYSGLAINDAYGLTIMHRDGRAEEARSAGAEHVVALALMGAFRQF